MWKMSLSKINKNRLVFSGNMWMNYLEFTFAICDG